MKPLNKVDLGRAALLAAAIVGCNLAPANTDVETGSPAPPTTAPTATPAPSQLTRATTGPTRTPGPWVLTNGPLVAHEYFTHPFGPPNERMTFTFEVPDGWVGFESVGVLPETGSEGPTGMGFGLALIERLYSNPCNAEFTTGFNVGDVEPGPTVDDLAAAFQDVTAYEASAPVEVELGGYAGKRVDLQFPAEFECAVDSFRPWEGSIYAQGPGDRWHLWILNVEGVRVVVLARDFAATPAADRAELQTIVDSLRITP
jgi:hypothetical protein